MLVLAPTANQKSYCSKVQFLWAGMSYSVLSRDMMRLPLPQTALRLSLSSAYRTSSHNMIVSCFSISFVIFSGSVNVEHDSMPCHCFFVKSMYAGSMTLEDEDQPQEVDSKAWRMDPIRRRGGLAFGTNVVEEELDVHR
jgi:hypothetical protein